MPKPFFGRSTIAAGNRRRATCLSIHLPVMRRSFQSSGSAPANSATAVSRNGARTSSEAAIEARSTLASTEWHQVEPDVLVQDALEVRARRRLVIARAHRRERIARHAVAEQRRHARRLAGAEPPVVALVGGRGGAGE